ncbi:unnamed protein product [Rotaria sp. Silwood2]|nr:unnamed protein product [Rotaria sp. Silwood2]CAF4524841.1 unnamed protein product [Rotaria sp. Silwood2]
MKEIEFRDRSYMNDTCTCDVSSLCITPLTITARGVNSTNSTSFTIPGLFTGCFFLAGMRQSTLECFYSESCISIIEEYLQVLIPSNKLTSPLNISIQSQFNINSTLDKILSEVMTEQWMGSASHSQYFFQCHVDTCTYLLTSRFNIVYIITTMIGLIGGLVKVLRILLPRIVKFIRRRISPPLTVLKESDPVRKSLLKQLWTWNHFANTAKISDEREIRQQFIATRLFIILLAISFVALVTYYVFERVTLLYHIESPTLEQFIHLQQDQLINNSLSCPCSTLAIQYEDIIQIDYVYHPVCSSRFSNPDRIEVIGYQATYFFLDFRVLAPSFFNALGLYCEVAAKHIEKSLASFIRLLFVNDQALNLEVFTEKTNAIINNFKSSTTRAFVCDLTIISNMTHNNGLMTTHSTNFVLIMGGTHPSYALMYGYTPHFISLKDPFDLCICFPGVQCHNPMAIYSNYSFLPVRLFNIPGLFTGCLPDEGIRHSSLICLFNQTCVDLISYWLNASKVLAIDANILNHFTPRSTIDEMINEVFVDRWNYSASYHDFYQRCRPDSCSYKLSKHNSIWLIVTAVFSLIGGLMKILQIAIPHTVRIVFSLYSRFERWWHRQPPPIIPRSKLSFQILINQFRQLNLFASEDSTKDDEHEIRSQILSTRIFIIVLVLTLIILTIYSARVEITKTVTNFSPSLYKYSQLYANHYQTLICTCTNIAIRHKKYIILQPNFHPICQSSFVDHRWLDGLVQTSFIPSGIFVRDFRSIGAAIFGTIASLCQLSMRTINDGLLDFGEQVILSTQVISKKQLTNQGQSLFYLFESTTANAFINSIQAFRDAIQTNSLISGYETSTFLNIFVQDEQNAQLLAEPIQYNHSCSCHKDSTCIDSAGVYNYPNPIINYSIPGFFIGCYIIEATLQSNLDLLYNQTAIDDFRAHIAFDDYNPDPFNTTALNASLLAYFNTTTPINKMMEKMMIDSWHMEVNYSAYYEQCQPNQCKYTYIVSHDVVFIVTTITGLVGGLTTILQFVIPRVVKLAFRIWIKYYRRTEVQPISIVSTIKD